MNLLDTFADLPLFQNSSLDWLVALVAMAGLFLVMLGARGAVRRFHKRQLATQRTELTEIPAEILSRTTAPFFLVVAIFAGLSTLSQSPRTAQFLQSVLMMTLFLQVGIWASAAVMAWLERRRRHNATLADRAVVGSLGVIAFIVRVAIWSLVGLLALDNLGVDVTALIAGLGIGGIAVALAAQNILGDLFASLSITFDKPFLVGDFLVIDDYMGSVEHIGVKSTQLRSLSGEQIIMSNADLLRSRVRNFGRMQERRVVMTHNVTYETPLARLEEIPDLIRETIESRDDTRFDRSHFVRHGAASLDFETVYFVLSADFNRYMDIQQALNLEIHRRFTELEIEFAYPTQRLYLSRVTEKPAGGQTSNAGH